MAALLRSVNDRPQPSVVRLAREHGVDCLRTFEKRALRLPALVFARALPALFSVERPLPPGPAMYPGQVRVGQQKGTRRRKTRCARPRGYSASLPGLS